MIYGWCGPARCAFSVGFKTSVSVGSRTVQNWCLVSSGQAISGQDTEIIFEISVFGQSIRVDKSELTRNSSLISLQSVLCFPVSSPIRVSLLRKKERRNERNR